MALLHDEMHDDILSIDGDHDRNHAGHIRGRVEVYGLQVDRTLHQ
jgi:hypothetical protein